MEQARSFVGSVQAALPHSSAAALLMALAALLCGCTAAQYRQQADSDVYKIVQQAEREVFGQTNRFSIDTAYSARAPKDILPTELIEQRLETGARLLTLSNALHLAVTHSRRYQTERERLYLTALTLTGERHEFGPQFFAQTEPRLTANGNGDTFGTLKSATGVGQLLKSGGALSVRLANDVLRYYTGDPQKSIVSVASINFAQPLLRNFGRNNPAVEALTQAERNVIYAVRNFGYFQDEFALDIATDYLDLVAQKDIVRNRYTNYLSRVTSTERLVARARDRERLSDVDQARQAELTAKNNYVNAVATYRNGLDSFKIKLGLTLGEKVTLEDQALDELEETGLITAPLDPVAAYRTGVERQLTMLNAIDQFEDTKRKVRIAANRLKADLNILASASANSDGPIDYTRFNVDNVRGSVGIELDLPLDRLNERNTYRATLVHFETAIRSLTLSLDTMKDNIDRGLRTLEQRRQNFEIQKNALQLADRRVESSLLLLEAGRAEVRDLVEAQDAQINAQNAVTAALVSYHTTRLELLLAIGALDTTQDKFWLRDHLAGLVVTPQSPAREAGGTEPVQPPESYFTN